MKSLQLWIHTHYKSIVIVIALIVAAIVIGVLIIQNQTNRGLAEEIKKQNDTIIGQTEAIKNLGLTNQKYIECIAKIFIAPPDQQKAIKGEINDPQTALENCRIEADGLVPEPNFNPFIRDETNQDESETTPPSRQDPTPSPEPDPEEEGNPPPEPTPDCDLGLILADCRDLPLL